MSAGESGGIGADPAGQSDEAARTRMPTAQLTVAALLESLAADTPAPGGGSVAALSGALGAALGAMVCRLTATRGSVGMTPQRASALAAELDDLRDRLLVGFDVDQEAYEGILLALRLPKQTETEQAARRTAIAEATRRATQVPLENARLCVRVLELCGVIVATGLPQAVTDAGVGAAAAFCGAQGALYNVFMNLTGLDDVGFTAATRAQAAALADVAEATRGQTDAAVRTAIGV